MNTTRIEFAPGHEDEALTEQDVAAKVRLMEAAPKLLKAAQMALHEMCNTTAPRVSFTGAVEALADAIAEADPEGRSLQEQSS